MGFGIRKFGSLVFRNWPSGAFFEEDMRYAWALMWPFAILFIAIIAIIYALVWIFAKLFEAMRSIALFRHVINFFGRAIGYLFLGKMWKK
ncbi:MAG: hypothetical protein A2405_01655 [Candidatus Yanofskybacteria bacterium RIFOXYC1_FULL_44_16]|nr:MAG: hypothetical protein A2241_00740 [Candidatus Yanofskybacteria bacterium RIFOXYA2_FULL_45_28]OGN36970.1 MAG: hypothetical protein A2207_01390 [Candidatus Yanofskybacteria bacterium RIFOXYA1_FULL_44_17]OGN38412.1 MAG: hypothetical protein A2405_01655 [Candidatus Yanofskybacteria bacterium RIFOXYC1_FULL_44_16]OGN39902.1 MAG: hypothetical protein A2457_03295 [Candidatus Yanofskybacteria bacterium RIFOXYC2_FULL_44_13]